MIRKVSLILFVAICLTLFYPVQAYISPDGEIEGIWQGTLKFSEMELRIVFTISRNQDNIITATYDVPEQNAIGAPVDEITFINGNVHIEIIPIEAVFKGKLKEDGKKINGQLMQGGMTLPLVLERTHTKLIIKRPQEPKEPFPYRIEEVVFENIDADITLAGTLTLPPSNGTFPAVCSVQFG